MSEPIRILHIVPNMQMGGLESFIMNIYRNINKESVQFDFMVHYKAEKYFDKEIEMLGGKIYRFSLRDDYRIIKYIKELDKFYKSHKEYKVIHCHMSSIGFLNFLVAKKNGIKVRIAHSHNNLTDKTIKGRIKRIMMLPYKYVSTLNFACSSSAGKFLYGKKKYEIIPNAIDTQKFTYNLESRQKIRKELKIDNDAFVIGHVGRFNIQKNHMFLIEIFEEILRKNKNSYLVLVGDGELKEKIEKAVKLKGIEKNVIFLGIRKDVNEVYQAFDSFLFPSFFEGLGITLIEAQISGLECFTSLGVVAKEAKITENLHFINLNKSASFWAEEVLKYKGYKRYSHDKQAIKCGFEIKRLAKKMENKYNQLYNMEK